MDNTMSSWTNALKHVIIKNDDFVEDYGFFNDADIANWFKTLESTFEQMLDRIGVDSNPDDLQGLAELLEGGYKPKANKRLSFNQRKIKQLENENNQLKSQKIPLIKISKNCGNISIFVKVTKYLDYSNFLALYI